MSHPTPPTKGEAGIYQKICITPNTPAHKDQHAQMLATTIHKSNTTPHHQSRATTAPPTPHRGQGTTGLLSQSPIVCPAIPQSSVPTPLLTFVACTKPPPTTGERVPHGSHPPQRKMSLVVLLRKEVIQPHLPVRLPCYDFVPIADPTFDGSLHKG